MRERVVRLVSSTRRNNPSHWSPILLLAKLDVRQRRCTHGANDLQRHGLLNLLAEKAGMSRRIFESHFKDATGKSPWQYLQLVRVESARYILENINNKFDEITYMVGYEDTSTFSRFFKKTIGLSPKSYKRKYHLGSA